MDCRQVVVVDWCGLDLWEAYGCEIVSVPHDDFGYGGKAHVFCVCRG